MPTTEVSIKARSARSQNGPQLFLTHLNIWTLPASLSFSLRRYILRLTDQFFPSEALPRKLPHDHIERIRIVHLKAIVSYLVKYIYAKNRT